LDLHQRPLLYTQLVAWNRTTFLFLRRELAQAITTVTTSEKERSYII
jgi:hypothetical protein